MLTLTILSGIALAVLLGFLAWALGKIALALQSITLSLEKIAMGVRAIEQETGHLIPGVTTLNQTFEGLAGGFDSVGTTLQKLS